MTRIPEGGGIRENFSDNGLLAASVADLYEVPTHTQVSIHTLILHNTHASNTNTVKLHVHPSGGTARVIVEEALTTKERLKGRGKPLELNEGDKLRGEATNADEVVWFISGIKHTRV